MFNFFTSQINITLSITNLISLLHLTMFLEISVFTDKFLTFKVSLAAAAAASLQLCPTLYDPTTAAHQDPLSPGFPRQDHWGGLPFPSPKHESEK